MQTDLVLTRPLHLEAGEAHLIVSVIHLVGMMGPCASFNASRTVEPMNW